MAGERGDEEAKKKWNGTTGMLLCTPCKVASPYYQVGVKFLIAIDCAIHIPARHLLASRGCTKRPGESVGEDEAAWRNVVQEKQMHEKEVESEEQIPR